MSLEEFDLDDLEHWEEGEGNGEGGEGGEGGEPGEPGEPGKGKGKGKKSAEDALDKHMDDHEGGNEEGENMEEGEEEDIDDSLLDKMQRQYEKAESSLVNSEDLTPEEAIDKAAGKAKEKGGRGSSGSGQTRQIDISQGKAYFGWEELIRKFISTAADPDPEESVSKPSRRAGSMMNSIQQQQATNPSGQAAGQLKPGEILTEENDAKLCFVVDSSGSMSGAVADIYANINSLLANNSRLGSKIFTMLRFSSTHEIFRCIFKGNKAAKVEDILEEPTKFDLHLDVVFKHHYGDATNFTSNITEKLSKLKKENYNLIVFSDADVCSGENLTELASLVRAPGGKVFIILESHSDWQQLKDSGKIDMSFVSYLYNR